MAHGGRTEIKTKQTASHLAKWEQRSCGPFLPVVSLNKQDYFYAFEISFKENKTPDGFNRVFLFTNLEVDLLWVEEIFNRIEGQRELTRNVRKQGLKLKNSSCNVRSQPLDGAKSHSLGL